MSNLMKPYLQKVFKNYSSYLPFIFIFLVASIIRLESVQWGALGFVDQQRDYLVGHHIAKYHEIPSVGPWSSLTSNLGHSPLYFYFLAGLLTIHDSIYVLKLTNCLLQIFSIIPIYFIAKKLFGNKSALIASAIYGFSATIISLSYYPEHANFTLPFINLSLLLLVVGYLEKRYLLVIASTVLIILTTGINMATLLLLPLFLVTVALVFAQLKINIYKYFFFLVLIFSLLFLIYPKLLQYLTLTNTNASLTSSNFFITSGTDYLHNLSNNFKLFTNLFVYGYNPLLIFLMVFCSLIIYVLYSQKEKSKKAYLLLSAFFILQPIIFLSLFKNPTYPYHLFPILGLTAILIAETINRVFSGNFVLFVCKILLIVLIIKTFSSGFYFMGTLRSQESLIPEKIFAEDELTIKKNSIVSVIMDSVKKEQRDNSFKDLNFFQIRYYNNQPPGGAREWAPQNDALFWIPLERNFKTKFVALSPPANSFYAYKYFSFWPTNKDDYMFLICEKMSDATSDSGCIKEFGNENSNYKKPQLIYSISPFTVYITTK